MTDLSTITFGSTTDPYRKAEERGWDITNATELAAPLELEADVVIVGTGAGGGTAAETLSKAGLSVVLLEAGPLKTSSQFDMKERAAYRDLYEEGTGRANKSGSMTILQGRSVGGSTTVNWTTSFRTPPETLKFWADNMGVTGCSVAELAPYFKQMETRLNIEKWGMPPNPNNDTLKTASEKLGYSWATIHRNVKGCVNLGYCGLGCPVDAKQSMLVTTIPTALDYKAKLIHHARVERVLVEGDAVVGVEASALTSDGWGTTGKTIKVRAARTVLAGGGINTPAVLLRSSVPDPHGRIGKRTFLHPTTLSMGIYDKAIDPYYGAPQSIYSDHFQWQTVDTGPVNFKLEVPPLQPAFAAAFYGAGGEMLTDSMDKLINTQCMIALMRDGFDERSEGGSIELNDRGEPIVDYELNAYLLEGVRRAWHTMVEMQFATGAKTVRPAHKEAQHYRSWTEAKAAIAGFKCAPHKVTVGSAHVMGGSAMGEDETRSVVNSEGKFHHLANLYVMDGSLFPTSIGANPQLSIYGLVLKLSTKLASQFSA
ncbi:MAG: GMC family oxidoreductase [Myxococcales bacterium]|nr:GMC family oxidoreductase [Myxococcales bacterium]